MHRPRRRTAVLALVAALVVAPAAAYAASTTISLSGATASFPLIELLTAKYHKLKHGKVIFRVSQGGATVGIQDAAAGRVSIGDSSRPPASTDPAGLVFYPVAKYFVCVATNPANPVSNLTAAQVQQIFSGKVRNWSQVSGATATGPIDVYTRTSVAGVLTTFQNTLLGGGKVGTFATQEASEGLMQNAIKKDPGAIGFLSDYFALAKGINAGRLQRHRVQRRQRRLGLLPRSLRLLRGHEGAGLGCRGGLHLLDPDELDGEEDHREQLDPARQDRAGA